MFYLVLNIITFHLENEDNPKVYFKGETTIFALQLMKIYVFVCQMMFYEIFKTKSYCSNGRHYSRTIGKEGDLTKTGQKILIDKWFKVTEKVNICYW